MEVRSNGRPLRDGELLSHTEGQEEFNVDWNYKPRKVYSLIMFDTKTQNGILTHWLRVNITPADFDDVLSYIPPNPPDKVHHYYIELYEQQEEMDFEGFTRQNSADVIKVLGFKKIYEFMFRVEP